MKKLSSLPSVPHVISMSPTLPSPTPLPSFDFRFRLSSAVSIPLALNAHITRSDFDPDFVATLLSRQPGHDVVDIILDTGCTFSITPDWRDFVTYEAVNSGQVQTVNGPTAMAGTGIVCWTLISENGDQMDLFLPFHHIPASTVRLLSPQDFCQHNGFDCSQDQFGGNSNYFWMHADHQRSRFQCPIDPRSNLPVALLAKTPCNPGGCVTESVTELITESSSREPKKAPCSCQRSLVSLSVLKETNQTITAAQKDLLLWHLSRSSRFCAPSTSDASSDS
jgi:hypothetical protein